LAYSIANSTISYEIVQRLITELSDTSGASAGETPDLKWREPEVLGGVYGDGSEKSISLVPSCIQFFMPVYAAKPHSLKVYLTVA